MDCGIHYVASGRKCLLEAIQNACLTRQHAGNFPISVSTDLVELAKDSEVFDSVIKHPCPTFSYRDKISALLHLPYKKTLYLDSDALVVSDLHNTFKLLDHYHIAGVPAPVRHPPGLSDNSVPQCFTEINSGVLFLKKCRLQTRVIRLWLKLYDELFQKYDQSWDQASLRSVLWKCIHRNKLRFCHLPTEFNLRTQNLGSQAEVCVCT